MRLRSQLVRTGHRPTVVTRAIAPEASGPHLSSIADTILWLQRVAGNRSVNDLVGQSDVFSERGTHVATMASKQLRLNDVPAEDSPRRSSARWVQRYQSGILGHGGIEEEGLKEAGFSGAMGSGGIGKIYFGNWLRDWSQLNPGPNSNWYPLFMNVVNILSMSEFDRPVSQDELGGYQPSEHLDNPLGGNSAEDDTATSPERGAALARLSSDQSQDVDREQTDSDKRRIELASAASGLPDYIERGKDHAKRKLEQALRQWRTPARRDDAMLDLGNALHAVEDYFAHSNFTEVALSILAAEGNTKAADLLEMTKAKEGFNAVAAGGDDPLRRGKAIITGTYGDESHFANQRVSLIEQLRSEVQTGELREAFIKGSARLAGRKVAGVEAVAGGIAGAAIGFTGGGVWGGLRGAAAGVEHGYKAGHGFWGTLESMGADFFLAAGAAPNLEQWKAQRSASPKACSWEMILVRQLESAARSAKSSVGPRQPRSSSP